MDDMPGMDEGEGWPEPEVAGTRVDGWSGEDGG